MFGMNMSVGNSAQQIVVADPFTPLSLSPRMWAKRSGPFHSDFVGTVVTANNSTVKKWFDAGTLDNNLNAPTDAARPLLKTNIQNSLPMLLSDGSNDVMSSAFALENPWTLFWVGKTAAAANKFYFGGGQSSGNDGISSTDGTDAALTSFFANAAAVVGSSAYICCGIFDGNNSRIRVNNGTAGTGNPGALAPNGLSVFADFNTNFSAIMVGEILVFPSALSLPNETLVRDYLNTAWAIF